MVFLRGRLAAPGASGDRSTGATGPRLATQPARKPDSRPEFPVRNTMAGGWKLARGIVRRD
ncbi:MAG: hypothetical protein LBL01_04840, partial [Bifidobacteriaceae bacterium]|nr:hypothetical protein [Bifidobacteriaceae bacterium]